MDFQEKFIGFIDILGFKNMVNDAESGSGISLQELLDYTSLLGSKNDEEKYYRGPKTCPESKFIQKNLDFKVSQVSDCVVVSSEVSPAGIINLVNHCWGSTIKLLMKGIMCRGYITKGKIYHNENFIGSGYQKACKNERDVTAFKREANERGTPFVEIDPVVCSYVENSTDKCVKEMFSRMIRTENDITALFPFQRLEHSFIVGGLPLEKQFDPDKEKESNNNIRILLTKVKERVMMHVEQSNVDAMRKVNHYIAALDRQLQVCDKVDKNIDMLCSYFPLRRY